MKPKRFFEYFGIHRFNLLVPDPTPPNDGDDDPPNPPPPPPPKTP